MKIFLLILLSFVGLTATVSGLMLISRPDGSLIKMPLGVLETSPFSNFLIPGIILLTMVGMVNCIAAWLLMRRHPARYNWAVWGGVMVGGWIVVQILMIQSFSWLQIVYLITALLIVLTAWQLKGKWIV
jgi:uncharacterized membrane protein